MTKKKDATGAIGYVMLFTMAIIMVIITLFMLASSKLMTIQHDVDDALADSVLAALVADDIYYFETWEGTGTAVVRFRDLDASYRLYRDCMKDAIEAENDFYGNIRYPTFICYEVEDGEVTITTFNESGGRSQTHGALGDVRTPTGEVVKETSAYGKVTFDLTSLIGGEPIGKSRDLYCTLEINNEESYEEVK